MSFKTSYRQTHFNSQLFSKASATEEDNIILFCTFQDACRKLGAPTMSVEKNYNATLTSTGKELHFLYGGRYKIRSFVQYWSSFSSYALAEKQNPIWTVIWKSGWAMNSNLSKKSYHWCQKMLYIGALCNTTEH